MKKKKLSSGRVIRNNIFAIKTIWNIKKSRVIGAFLNAAFGYLVWEFFSSYFLKRILEFISTAAPYEQVLQFILVVGIVVLGISIFQAYYSAITVPMCEVSIYKVLYRDIYKRQKM